MSLEKKNSRFHFRHLFLLHTSTHSNWTCLQPPFEKTDLRKRGAAENNGEVTSRPPIHWEREGKTKGDPLIHPNLIFLPSSPSFTHSPIPMSNRRSRILEYEGPPSSWCGATGCTTMSSCLTSNMIAVYSDKGLKQFAQFAAADLPVLANQPYKGCDLLP